MVFIFTWPSLQCQVSQHSILTTDNYELETALLEEDTALNLYKPSEKIIYQQIDYVF